MREEDIRPQDIFNRYLELAKLDIDLFFGSCERENGSCPACSAKGSAAFIKSGFQYEECPSCMTLFVNPRPISSAFEKFYTESASVEFWATTFYKETADARRELLWKPKAKMIGDVITTFCSDIAPESIIDIGGGYGIFAEEIQKVVGIPCVVIEPGPTLAEVCREKGLPVIEKFLDSILIGDLPHGKKVFVSFELFEHLHSPKEFIQSLNNVMDSGDIFIFTTLSGTGVDIRVLWENAKCVYPPHHLNFFNPKSIPILLNRLGFECLEITTPGKLDIDIMLNSENLITDRFWKSFLSQADEEDKILMQKTIAETKSSSHIMVVCEKR